MSVTFVMVLLKYLKLKQRDTKNCLECLPDASGPLAIAMPSDSITATNSSVEKVFKQTEVKKPRGDKQQFTVSPRQLNTTGRIVLTDRRFPQAVCLT